MSVLTCWHQRYLTQEHKPAGSETCQAMTRAVLIWTVALLLQFAHNFIIPVKRHIKLYDGQITRGCQQDQLVYFLHCIPTHVQSRMRVCLRM